MAISTNRFIDPKTRLTITSIDNNLSPTVNLSDIVIDNDKDWAGESITNLASLGLNGTISLYDSETLAGAIQANALGMVSIGTQAGYDLYLSSTDDMDISADNLDITVSGYAKLNGNPILTSASFKLSDLSIDANKDWDGKSITNLSSLSVLGTLSLYDSTTLIGSIAGTALLGVTIGTDTGYDLILSSSEDMDISADNIVMTTSGDISLTPTGVVNITNGKLLSDLNANTKSITGLLNLSYTGSIYSYSGVTKIGTLTSTSTGLYLTSESGKHIAISSGGNIDIVGTVTTITGGKLGGNLDGNSKSITALDSVTGTGTFTAGYLKSTTATHFYSGITKVGDVTYAAGVLSLAAETNLDLSLNVSGTGKVKIDTSQLLDNMDANSKTISSAVLSSPAINGTVTTTGLTMPAFAVGGNITWGSNETYSVGATALHPTNVYTKNLALDYGTADIGYLYGASAVLVKLASLKGLTLETTDGDLTLTANAGNKVKANVLEITSELYIPAVA